MPHLYPCMFYKYVNYYDPSDTIVYASFQYPYPMVYKGGKQEKEKE